MDEIRKEFDKWMRAVDNEIGLRVGMSADDLPDVDYWSMFVDGMTSADAAKHAIRNACDDMPIDADALLGEDSE